MTLQPPRGHLTVLDVMTAEVVVAHPDDPIQAVARRLFDNGVSALPVVDGERHVLGMVSEDDLLVKQGGVPEGGHILHRGQKKRDVARAAALHAGQAMTTPAVTTSPTASLAEAARVMHQRRVKRLPVVDAEGRMLGVVSRHDVLKVFSRSDESIREEVIQGVLRRDVMIDTAGVQVEVENGVVTLAGEIERRTHVPVITFLVESVDGVVGVCNVLTYRWDDTQVEYLGTIPRGVAGMT